MMRLSLRKALFISCGAGAFLSLGGCGSGNEAESPKSMAEVKQEAAKLVHPQPGQYKQIVEIRQIDIPGMPKEAAERMKAMMETRQDREFCLSKDEADKGFRDMFDRVGKQDDTCTYAKFDVDGGTLDARMECKAGQGATGTIDLHGTVGETASDITMAMDVSGGSAPMGNMKMKMHMSLQRMGACKS